MFVSAIIAAAGAGRRLGAAQPKQLLDIGGGSMLQHSLAAFLGHPRVSEVIVVLPAGMSLERFDRIESYGGQVIKTIGSESNVKEIYDKTWELRADPTIQQRFLEV